MRLSTMIFAILLLLLMAFQALLPFIFLVAFYYRVTFFSGATTKLHTCHRCVEASSERHCQHTSSDSLWAFFTTFLVFFVIAIQINEFQIISQFTKIGSVDMDKINYPADGDLFIVSEEV